MAAELTVRVLDLLAAGQIGEAEALVAAVCREAPNDPEAMRMRAVILWKQGRREAARGILEELLATSAADETALRLLGALHMEDAEASAAAAVYERLCTLPSAGVHDRVLWAEALTAAGRYRQAETILDALLPVSREYPEVRLRLADVYLGEERIDEAVAMLERAREAAPDDPAVLAALARLYAMRGQRAEGLEVMKRYTALQPDNAKAWLERARFHFWANEYAESLVAASRALELAPADAEIHYQLGELCVRLKAYQLAEQHYRRAGELAPQLRDDAEAAIAIARFNRGETESAENLLEDMLKRHPESFAARRGLIYLYDQTLRHERTLPLLDELVRRSSGNAMFRFNRALALLRLGRFREGWEEWEVRFQTGLRAIESDKPLWSGEPIEGKTVTVVWEQGFGDTLQCVRLLPLLRRRGARVILVCQVGLGTLLERSGLADEVVELPLGYGSLPEHDIWIRLMSLPHLLGIDLSNLPREVPYLAADPGLVERWRQEMVRGPELRVGLVWSGSPTHSNDPQRSCPTEKIARLAGVPGVRWFSLLRGPDAAQLERLQKELDIEELGSRFSNFDDTAAALMNVDLLISVDTSVAHLAGALARPVWLLLPVNPDWRWLLGRDDTPWYPTMRLYRQQHFQDWDGLLATVADDLRALAASYRG